MLSLDNPLVKLYATLIGWVLTGFILGRYLPKGASTSLGKFLFLCGTPFSIIAFMRRTNLSGYLVISPLTAWTALLVGAGLAWIWIDLGVSDERLKAISRGLTNSANVNSITTLTASSRAIKTAWGKPTQGSFLLAMMLGNTAFLGFPIVLSLIGEQYFAWALFYDLSISLGVHIFGVALAAYYGTAPKIKGLKGSILTVLKNPALWAFAIGLVVRILPLPPQTDKVLQTGAWTVITLFLIMIGIQLSKLSSLQNLKQGLTCLAIKMLLTPLVVGTGLMFFGITGPPRLLLVLLMGMPPAFITTLFAEKYGLDRDLAVTTVAIGCGAVLFTIPIWLWLFGF
jgi:predicted permease